LQTYDYHIEHITLRVKTIPTGSMTEPDTMEERKFLLELKKGNKKGFGKIPKPLSALVAGSGFEPETFGL
jgi:hypothetical protein